MLDLKVESAEEGGCAPMVPAPGGAVLGPAVGVQCWGCIPIACKCRPWAKPSARGRP